MDTIRPIYPFLLLLAVAIISAGETPVPRERVISFWSGEPNPGTGRRLDQIGSNHLWDSPEAAVAPGKIGIANDFTGSNGLRTKLATNTNASSIVSVGRDISYAGWIRFDSIAANQTIGGRWGGWAPGREHRLYLDAAAGVLKLEWANSGNTARRTVADTLPIVANQWYFVAYGRNDAAAESWLCVTPDTEGAPRAKVTIGAVATNPSSNNAQLEFGHNDSANRMDGRWNQWGIYAGTLSAAELAWLFHAGTGRALADFSYVQEPAMGYFHDFEQEAHNTGRISYQQYYGNVVRSTEQAKTGSNSLKIFGSWGQIQVYNNSNTNYWCTTEECKVSMDLYMVNFVTSSMLFQMDGKTSTVLTDLDTNEGLGVNFYLENGRRGFAFGTTRTSGYDLPLNQWVHLTYLRKRNALAPGYTMALYADGVLILSVTGPAAPVAITPYVAKAWHHISLGNDRLEAPTFYLDNFSVRPLARVQDPPEIDVLPDRSTMVGAAISLDATVYDVDGDPLTFAWTRIAGPTDVTFSTPGAVDTSATFGSSGTYVLQLAVTDGHATSTRQFTVTASAGGINAPPIISGGAASVGLSTLEDATSTTTLTASDTDGDPLGWSIHTQGTKGIASVSAAGSPVTVTYVPTAQANGSDTVVVQVADGQGGSDTITVNVTITAVNDAPSFSKGGDQSVAEDGGAQSVANWATAVSKGPADEAGQTLTFSVSNTNNPLFAVQPAVSATGTLTYTPAAGTHGSATVSVTLGDNGGTANGGVNSSGTQTFIITVTSVNDSPELATAIPDQTATTGTAFAYVIPLASFVDVDGDALTWSASGLPGWLSFTPATRTLSGTPLAGDVGAAAITITVTDPSSDAASDSFQLTVVAASVGPSITAGGGGGGGCGAGLSTALLAAGLLLALRQRTQ